MLAGFQVKKNSSFRDDIRLQFQYFAKHFPKCTELISTYNRRITFKELKTRILEVYTNYLQIANNAVPKEKKIILERNSIDTFMKSIAK